MYEPQPVYPAPETEQHQLHREPAPPLPNELRPSQPPAPLLPQPEAATEYFPSQLPKSAEFSPGYPAPSAAGNRGGLSRLMPTLPSVSLEPPQVLRSFGGRVSGLFRSMRRDSASHTTIIQPAPTEIVTQPEESYPYAPVAKHNWAPPAEVERQPLPLSPPADSSTHQVTEFNDGPSIRRMNRTEWEQERLPKQATPSTTESAIMRVPVPQQTELEIWPHAKQTTPTAAVPNQVIITPRQRRITAPPLMLTPSGQSARQIHENNTSTGGPRL